MNGPCLCGDPYCPHCSGADPALEDISEEIVDTLDIRTEAEGRFLLAAIPAILAAYRETSNWECREIQRIADQAAHEAALAEEESHGDRSRDVPALRQ